MPRIEGLRYKLLSLLEMPPTEAQGTFRWLHHTYFLHHYPSFRDPKEKLDLSDEVFLEAEPFEKNLAREVFQRHARYFGLLEQQTLAELCLPSTKSLAWGAFIAGLSYSCIKISVREWIKDRLPFAVFTAECACEAAVNAISLKFPELLQATLSDPTILQQRVLRMEPNNNRERWVEYTSALSDAFVDLVLEAAIKLLYLPGIEKSLAAGANPNIGIWCLERSSNTKYSPLSYVIENECPMAVDLLLKAGADPSGTTYENKGHSLFHALLNGHDDVADNLLAAGASFSEEGTLREYQIKDGVPSLRLLYFENIPHSREEEYIQWATQSLGSLIPLEDVFMRRIYYVSSHHFMLPTIVGDSDDLDRLKKYEAKGLDTTLTAEEICLLIDSDAYRCLEYLISKYGAEVWERAFFTILGRFPNFGTLDREIETQPQDDEINLLPHFDANEQEGLPLPDGSIIYAYLDAIAAPGHSHGPYPHSIFILQVGGVFQRRGSRVLMTKLKKAWRMAKKPTTEEEIWYLLPCIKKINDRFIWLGLTIEELVQTTRNTRLAEELDEWKQSKAGKWVINEAILRIINQAPSNIS